MAVDSLVKVLHRSLVASSPGSVSNGPSIT